MKSSTRNYLAVGLIPLVTAACIYYLSHHIKNKDEREMAIGSLLFPAIGGGAVALYFAGAETRGDQAESELVKKAQSFKQK